MKQLKVWMFLICFALDLTYLKDKCADRIVIGREFQSLGPIIIKKALSPKQNLCARGTHYSFIPIT